MHWWCRGWAGRLLMMVQCLRGKFPLRIRGRGLSLKLGLLAYAVKVLAFGELLNYKIVEIEIMRDNHESLLNVYICSSASGFERNMNELQHGFCGELEGIHDNTMDPDLTSIVD